MENELALLCYSIKDGVARFSHTVTYPKFGGKGFGTTLFEFAPNEVTHDELLIELQYQFIDTFIARNFQKYTTLMNSSNRET
jgi:predicted GNAT family acetyltransferase